MMGVSLFLPSADTPNSAPKPGAFQWIALDGIGQAN